MARNRGSSPGRPASPSACAAGTIARTWARARSIHSCAVAACRTWKARARIGNGSEHVLHTPRGSGCGGERMYCRFEGDRGSSRSYRHMRSAARRTPMSPVTRPNALPWLILSGIVIVLDQLSKWWVLTSLPEYTAVPVIEGVWNWYRTYNTGAAFSFLADAGGWQKWFFTVLGVGISGLLAFWLSRTPRGDWRTALPFALVIGGALGNIIDRQVHGHVVDFIQWHWREHYWPAFNIADCAVVGGAIGIALFGLFQGKGADAAKSR